MENIEIIKFEIEDLCMDIRVSMDEKTAWLSLNDLAKLFKKSKSVISRYIKKILEEATLESGSVVAKNTPVVAKSETTAEDGKRYKINLYNLATVIILGDKIKSDRGELLKAFVDDHFNESETNNLNHIIIYNNGNISIDVNVSPEEETVWLNQRQIAELFGISQPNVSVHIRNILDEGELDNSVYKENLYTGSVTEESSYTDPVGAKNAHTDSVVKKSLNTEIYQKEIRHIASDGKEYSVTFYNLDMILAIEYRVKSNRAIQFRRWASEVLKKYMMTGYVVDKDRAVVTANNFLRLENDVEVLKKQVSGLIEKDFDDEKIFVDGEVFDARAFIKDLVIKANETIILVDAYSDSRTLDYLKIKQPDVTIKLYTSIYGKLTQDDIDAFNAQYGGLDVFIDSTFHDRFLILDEEKVFHLGASLNCIGNKTFGINRIIEEENIIRVLDRIKMIDNSKEE